jgi:hypothetical protein
MNNKDIREITKAYLLALYNEKPFYSESNSLNERVNMAIEKMTSNQLTASEPDELIKEVIFKSSEVKAIKQPKLDIF